MRHDHTDKVTTVGMLQQFEQITLIFGK